MKQVGEMNSNSMNSPGISTATFGAARDRVGGGQRRNGGPARPPSSFSRSILHPEATGSQSSAPVYISGMKGMKSTVNIKSPATRSSSLKGKSPQLSIPTQHSTSLRLNIPRRALLESGRTFQNSSNSITTLSSHKTSGDVGGPNINEEGKENLTLSSTPSIATRGSNRLRQSTTPGVYASSIAGGEGSSSAPFPGSSATPSESTSTGIPRPRRQSITSRRTAATSSSLSVKLKESIGNAPAKLSASRSFFQQPSPFFTSTKSGTSSNSTAPTLAENQVPLLQRTTSFAGSKLMPSAASLPRRRMDADDIRRRKESIRRTVFFLHTEMHVGKDLSKKLKALGATVEMVLSKAVKIVITDRTLPNAMKVYTPNQLIEHSKAFDFLEKCPHVRVWSIEKLMELLENIDVRAQSQPQDLASQIQHEKMHGLATAREGADSKFHVLKSPYWMIEDATEVHRPILIKDYRSAGGGKKDPWPALYLPVKLGGCPMMPPPPEAASTKKVAAAPFLPKYATRQSKIVISKSNEPAPPSAIPIHAIPDVAGMKKRSADNVSAIDEGSAASGLRSCSLATLKPHQRESNIHQNPKLFHIIDKRVPIPIPSAAPPKIKSPETAACQNDATNKKPPAAKKRKVAGFTLVGKSFYHRPGFCENCNCKYDSYMDHVNGPIHAVYVANESSVFRELDLLLAMPSKFTGIKVDPSYWDETPEPCIEKDHSSVVVEADVAVPMPVQDTKNTYNSSDEFEKDEQSPENHSEQSDNPPIHESKENEDNQDVSLIGVVCMDQDKKEDKCQSMSSGCQSQTSSCSNNPCLGHAPELQEESTVMAVELAPEPMPLEMPVPATPSMKFGQYLLHSAVLSDSVKCSPATVVAYLSDRASSPNHSSTMKSPIAESPRLKSHPSSRYPSCPSSDPIQCVADEEVVQTKVLLLNPSGSSSLSEISEVQDTLSYNEGMDDKVFQDDKVFFPSYGTPQESIAAVEDCVSPSKMEDLSPDKTINNENQDILVCAGSPCPLTAANSVSCEPEMVTEMKLLPDLPEPCAVVVMDEAIISIIPPEHGLDAAAQGLEDSCGVESSIFLDAMSPAPTPNQDHKVQESTDTNEKENDQKALVIEHHMNQPAKRPKLVSDASEKAIILAEQSTNSLFAEEENPAISSDVVHRDPVILIKGKSSANCKGSSSSRQCVFDLSLSSQATPNPVSVPSDVVVEWEAFGNLTRSQRRKIEKIYTPSVAMSLDATVSTGSVGGGDSGKRELSMSASSSYRTPIRPRKGSRPRLPLALVKDYAEELKSHEMGLSLNSMLMKSANHVVQDEKVELAVKAEENEPKPKFTQDIANGSAEVSVSFCPVTSNTNRSQPDVEESHQPLPILDPESKSSGIERSRNVFISPGSLDLTLPCEPCPVVVCGGSDTDFTYRLRRRRSSVMGEIPIGLMNPIPGSVEKPILACTPAAVNHVIDYAGVSVAEGKKDEEDDIVIAVPSPPLMMTPAARMTNRKRKNMEVEEYTFSSTRRARRASSFGGHENIHDDGVTRRRSARLSSML